MDVHILWVVLPLAVVLLALFINGWTDAPNALATIVVVGKVPVMIAVPIAALCNAIGAFFGTAVAKTVLDGIVVKEVLSLEVITSGMLSVVVWGYVAAHRGWPISKSHALLAGLAGAGFAGGVIHAFGQHGFSPYLLWRGGFDSLLPSGWIKVAWGLPISLLVGFAGAFVVGKLAFICFADCSPRVMKPVFAVMHCFAAVAAALGHGMNDTQKSIGVFTLVLFTSHAILDTTIHWWVIALCSATIGLGTACGGWRIMDMLGRKLGPMQPWQGAVAMFTASAIIILTSLKGIPLSTTHTTSSSIAGSIGSYRLSNVKKDVALSIVQGWIFTFPSCGVLAASTALVVHVLKSTFF